MKRLLHIIILIGIGQNLNAQYFLPTSYDTIIRKYDLSISGNISSSSNGIRNEIARAFMFGGEINDPMKSRISEKNANIRIGFDASTDIIFKNYNATLFKNWGYQIGIGTGYLGSFRASNDLVKMIFYGNTRYLGESISLDALNLNFLGYQKLGFGLVHKKTKSFVSLSYYNISSAIKGKINNGQMYTSSFGDTVQINAEGYFNTSNSNSFIKGFGLGLDADIYFTIDGIDANKSFVQILVRNFGFSNVSEKSMNYNLNTAFDFDGFRFNELISDNAVLSDNNRILDTLDIEKKSKNAFQLLPGFIQIGKIVDELSTKKWQMFFGARMYPTLAYFPMVYFGYQYKPIHFFRVGANISYGGFTGVSGGFYLSSKVKNWDISLGSENIVGTVYNRGFSQSIQFSVKWGI